MKEQMTYLKYLLKRDNDLRNNVKKCIVTLSSIDKENCVISYNYCEEIYCVVNNSNGYVINLSNGMPIPIIDINYISSNKELMDSTYYVPTISIKDVNWNNLTNEEHKNILKKYISLKSKSKSKEKVLKR